jgi:non-specific serine/threonine protein kinase
MVNAAHYAQREEEGVATVRRAVQLVGLDGVRRAATALRAWPGPLDERGAQGLQAGMRQAFVAGQLAAILAPGGLDEEGSLITAQLQHLGRLLALYHFPDEAAQIAQLMKSSPPSEPGAAPVPGLPEAGAAMAVLGVDLESLAAAVARHWGLDEAVQVMMRPLPLDQPVRAPESVDGWMRLVASCANEVLQVALAPPAQQVRALQTVVARYHKALGVTVESLKDAFTKARQRVNDRVAVDKAPSAT